MKQHRARLDEAIADIRQRLAGGTATSDLAAEQTFTPELVDAAQGRGVPFVPGALTPIEVVRAWEHGVPTVKISPIAPVSALDYLAELRGPLPDIPLIPTGASRRRPQRSISVAVRWP